MRARIAGALLAVSAVAAADAPPPAKDAPAACVNREKTAWRQVRDATADASTLTFCTGDDCWAYHLVAKSVSAIGKLPAGSKPASPEGTATATHAEFCTAPGACKGFDFKLPSPPVNGVSAIMNTEHTLGAVMARGESEAGKPSTVLTFDLVTGKPIKQLRANDVVVLAHGFLIGDDQLYNAKMKRVGKLAVADGGWERIGTTDVLALHDKVKGAVVLQDATTAKVLGRIDLGAADPAEWWTYVVSSDGNRLYAIGSAQDEGTIVVIDVTNKAVVERTSPPVCAKGTRRVN